MCVSLKCFLLITGLLAVPIILASLGCLDSFALSKLPQLPSTTYWGKGEQPKAPSEKITEFKVAVGDAALKDLQTRLKSFKFIEPLEDARFEYGFNGKFTQQLVRHWLDKYNWREWEKRINSFRHFRTQIEGLSVHFLRATPTKAKRVVPLMIVHGWPGSFFEFHKLIPMLTQPDANGLAFDVVAPSIPGYGWSEAPSKRGFSVTACARIFHKLMQRIGHSRYYIQGGDWGSLITMVMSRQFEASVLGYHSNMPIAPSGVPSAVMQTLLGTFLPGVFSQKDSEKVYPLFGRLVDMLRETGYMHLQATRPDTVAHALHDSPVGLATYILEKFSVWTVPTDRFLPDGNLVGQKAHFNLDELLTNVMIYWVTDSITSSVRLYKEVFDNYGDVGAHAATPTSVPYGAASFKFELARIPERQLRVTHSNMLRYKDFDFGGHFAAMQLPQTMHNEIREFVKLAEKFNEKRFSTKKTEL